MWLPLLAELLEHMLVVPCHLAGVALDPAGEQISFALKIRQTVTCMKGGWLKRFFKYPKTPKGKFKLFF